ncbi:hypothetical protein ACWV26_02440 [Rummeliibacillus sp. JY-2-4R]
MPFLPIGFYIAYLLFLQKAIFGNKSIVATIFSILSFFRYIVLPLTVSLTQNYGIGYIHISNDTYYHKAFALMIFELFVISIIIYLYTNRYRNAFTFKRTTALKLYGTRFIYCLFLGVAILIYLAYPGATEMLQFLKINITGERIVEEISTTDMIVRQILTTATIIFYLICLDHFHKLYERTKSSRYVYFSVIISVIQISIIIGERRSFQLYTTFIVLYILLKIYKNHKRKITLIIVSSASLVLIGMSIYKFLYAFEYNSYFEAIQQSDKNYSNFANYLQLYLLGPQNIAITLEFAENVNTNISNLLFDLCRSTIGLSFLVKNLDVINTTALFNSYIYGGETNTGHLISSIGYGYIYFGFLLSPIFSGIITVFALTIEKAFKKADSYEVVYLLGYILIRAMMGIFTAITALLNIVSLMFISLGIVYLVARIAHILLPKKVVSKKSSREVSYEHYQENITSKIH